MKALIEVSPGCFGNNLTFSGWVHFAKIVDAIMATTLSDTYKVHLIEAYAYHFPKDYLAGITLNSGPPPSIGWWPTNYNIRWWDGEFWSIGVSPNADADEAGLAASHFNSRNHQWLPRWWE